jgi:hypothetical protein
MATMELQKKIEKLNQQKARQEEQKRALALKEANLNKEIAEAEKKWEKTCNHNFGRKLKEFGCNLTEIDFEKIDFKEVAETILLMGGIDSKPDIISKEQLKEEPL